MSDPAKPALSAEDKQRLLNTIDAMRAMAEADLIQWLIFVPLLFETDVRDPYPIHVGGAEMAIVELQGIMFGVSQEIYRKHSEARVRMAQEQAARAAQATQIVDPIPWQERRVPDGRGGLRQAMGQSDYGDAGGPP